MTCHEASSDRARRLQTSELRRSMTDPFDMRSFRGIRARLGHRQSATMARERAASRARDHTTSPVRAVPLEHPW